MSKIKVPLMGPGEARDVNMAVLKLPNWLILPMLPPPTIISGDHLPEGNVNLTGIQSFIPSEAMRRSQALSALGIKPGISAKELDAFLRMLAKCAYATAFLIADKAHFNPLVLGAIQGSEPITMYVGSDTTGRQPNKKSYYDLRMASRDGYLIVSISIFSHIGMGFYDVVVGSLER